MFKKKTSIIAVFTLITLLAVGFTVAYADGCWKHAENFKDGILNIWDPVPTAGETVIWEGGSISERELTGIESGFPVRYAHGDGKATWYINGAFEQTDEGTYYGGKRNGKIIQHFADGRVVESYWEHGVRVDN